MNASVDLLQQDADNRRAALELTQSFIVQAPAGAGKTELLTQRFLGLLTTVDAPEQIVAITFTRKAAAEMRNRILVRLEAALQPEPCDKKEHERITWQLARAALDADAKRGWKLLENSDRLRIMTFDSLCASLVRQMPYLSRFGGMPGIADKPEIHYAEAAKRTVLSVEEIPAVATALEYLDNDAGKLQQLLVDMLASREQWLLHIPNVRTGNDAVLRDQLQKELTLSLRRLVERDLGVPAQLLVSIQTPELMAAARYVADFAPLEAPNPLQDWQTVLGGTADDLARWQALARMLLTAKGTGTPVKTIGKNIGLPAEKEAPDVQVFNEHKAAIKAASAYLANDEQAAALRAAVACPVPAYATADIAVIEIFVEVLVQAYARLRVAFQEAGEVDFSEVAERALKALGEEEEPSDLALKLDYALRHLLVDEFQDTNRQQVHLLERLTAGWQAGDGRTLFVVGDPMQSIYRFRKADVGLFLHAQSAGIGDIRLQPLALYRNNRSVPKIVAWVNESFQSVFPLEEDAERGKVRYAVAHASREEPGAVSGAFWHPLVTGGATVDEARADADVAGEIVETGREDGDELEAQEILKIIDDEWQADSQRDIAILVRARSHLTPLVAEIRRSRPTLRYEAVEIESLSERQPVQDLMALTRALCHRADRVNWLAVLRAPWCGLTLVDLYALAKPDEVEEGADRRPLPAIWALMQDDARVSQLSGDGQTRLRHARHALQEAMDNTGRYALRRQVESAWLRLGGNVCVGSASDVEDVRAFFRLLDKLDAAGRFDLDRLEEEIKDLFAAPSTDKSAGKLKFMTVHKSKGLEFDTVVLPGLHRKTGRNEQRLLAWEGAFGEHLVVAPYRRAGANNDDNANADTLRAYINALEAVRMDQENRRVLYVAATRAIRSLHLLGVVKAKRNKKGEYTLAPAKNTPLDILWPLAASEFELALKTKQARMARGETDAGASISGGGIESFVPQLQRLPLESLPEVLAPMATGEAEETPDSAQAYFATSSLSPHVGTLVHQYLELIARHGLEGWNAARVRELVPVFRLWLSQQGHDASACKTGAERVERALMNAITDARGRWILQARRDQSACELALTSMDEGELRNHVLDRTFVEEGIRWVIDYKTSSHEGGDVDAFIEAKRKEYAGQLQRYAALFKADNLPIKKAIYFVELNRFVGIE